jgi:hypothetical protein
MARVIRLRVLFFSLVLLSAACLYVSIACYTQMKEYQQQITNQNKRIDEAVNKWLQLNEEDLVLIERIEEQNKRIKAQDDKIRIQDAVIAETRARKKK